MNRMMWLLSTTTLQKAVARRFVFYFIYFAVFVWRRMEFVSGLTGIVQDKPVSCV